MAIETSAPRSRRSLLAAAVGGLAGLVTGALGRPAPAEAAAGGPLILGANNDSGTSQTTLKNAGFGAAFTLQTTNVSTNATGIFGWSSSALANSTKGVYGKADGPNSYGVFGRQNGGTSGSGAAVFGEGNENDGLVGTTNSTERYAVKGQAPSTGIYGKATSTLGVTAGVYGEAAGEGGSAGVLGFGLGNAAGLKGLTTELSSIGVLGESSGSTSTGVYGWANAPTSQNYGVYARTESASGWGVWSDGDINIDGDLVVGGSKTGYVADVAVNGGKVTLHQGDAVTLIGVKAAVLGKIPLLEVGPAKAGDPIIGIVDRLAEVSTAKRPNGVAGMATHIHGRGTTVKPGDHLLVVTMGAFAAAGVDASAGPIAVGDELAVGAKPGKLAKSTGTGRSAGYALGKLADGTGRMGVFVSPR